MCKFVELKFLVNLNKTLSKFNYYDLKSKTNEQNFFLQKKIGKFKKGFNDCNSNKVENI